MYDEMQEWFHELVRAWNTSEGTERKEVGEQLKNLGAVLINGVWYYDPEDTEMER